MPLSASLGPGYKTHSRIGKAPHAHPQPRFRWRAPPQPVRVQRSTSDWSISSCQLSPARKHESMASKFDCALSPMTPGTPPKTAISWKRRLSRKLRFLYVATCKLCGDVLGLGLRGLLVLDLRSPRPFRRGGKMWGVSCLRILRLLNRYLVMRRQLLASCEHVQGGVSSALCPGQTLRKELPQQVKT
jgi:hypothetical protein